MNQFADFEIRNWKLETGNRKLEIGNSKIVRCPVSRQPSDPMLQSPITYRKSPMARWPDEPMTRWFDESPLASDAPNLV
jgi:hypothetical protein